MFRVKFNTTGPLSSFEAKWHVYDRVLLHRFLCIRKYEHNISVTQGYLNVNILLPVLVLVNDEYCSAYSWM